MLESLIQQNESKTLEFKENTKSLNSIRKAVVAFANTSGGMIVIGVSDKEKRIVGVENPLEEEERIANAIADSIEPLIIPDIQISSIRNKELLIIQVHHAVGPFYLKSLGLERGTYVRVGSTNRLADNEIILSLQMLAKNISFDELPCAGAALSDIDDPIVKTNLSPILNGITEKQYESLGIVTRRHGKLSPTNGGILLFGSDRFKWFPDASIVCVCFADDTHEEIIDQQEIKLPLIMAHEAIFSFIRRHIKVGARIRESVREDIPEYPPQAIREAVINAIVHADYSLKGGQIQVAIFSNRIEITSPGGLPYGQTMEFALSGISLMRNRVMGRLFREVKLIERLGTGLKRIISIYEKTNAKQPIFEELNAHFRVTLYSVETLAVELEFWEQQLMENLIQQGSQRTIEIAELWGVTTRTARTRLKKMAEAGLINRVATSIKDPYAVFKLQLEEKAMKIKYKDCDISCQIYGNIHVGYSATTCITVYAQDVVDTKFTLDKHYSSFDLAEAEIIEQSKKWIDEQIKAGRFRSIKK